MTQMTRRSAVVGLLGSGVAGTFASSLLGGSSLAAAKVSILSWGWGYDAVIKDVVARKFPDLSVNLEIGTNAANYSKLVAQRGNPVLSGGTFNGVFSYRGHQDGLWVPIARSSVANADNLLDLAFMKDTGGVVFGVQPYGIVYNPERAEPPKSWLDLFDPKYKGKVGLSDFYFDGYGLTALAIGKPFSDIEAGIAEWAKHKANIGPWPQSPAQAQDLVERGEIWFAPSFGGIAEGARATGKKIAFTIPKEGATAVTDVIQVIKGFDKETTEQTQKFLTSFLNDDAQVAFTKSVFTSPVSKTAKIPPELAGSSALLSAERVASLIVPDFGVMGAKFAEFKNSVNRNLKS
jgi:putative spermidine/putrescine transport system substrate-binding protein